MFPFLQRFSYYLSTRTVTFRALLCVLLGAMGALSFAPVSQPIFFILGFAAFTQIIRSSLTRKNTFWFSWLYALGLHTAGLYWISASLFIDIHRYWWVLPFSLLALPAWLGFLFASAATLAFPFRTHAANHALALATLIFFAEILRGILFSGFPWNQFGYIWTGTLPVLQAVSLFGIEGLTLLSLLAAAATGLIFEAPRKSSILFIALSWLALSGLALWGEHRLDTTTVENVPGVQLRLVQAAVPQVQRRTLEQRVDALKHYTDLSQTAGAHTHLIWPETASPFFLTTDDPARNELAKIIPKNGALLTGAPSRDGVRYYNSLIVMDDKGDVRGIYDKTHLVPFGEYIPLRGILRVVPIAADVTNSVDFSHGTGPKTLKAPGLPPLSAMICYEAIFGGQIVDEYTQPQWLLQITNDGWFGDTSGPYQHFDMARVRAIEEGLPLVRAANSGISAIVDPLGRIVKSLPLNARGVVDGPLPQALPSQLFTNDSRFAVILCALSLLFAAVWNRALQARRR